MPSDAGRLGGQWFAPVAAAALLLGLAPVGAKAADGFDLTLPRESVQDQPAMAATADDTRVDAGGISGFLADWRARATQVRESQPHWSSPLITTTALLEQRVRFDFQDQHSGNGTSTRVIDGGKGLDLIISDSNEFQFASIPYYIRTGVPGTGKKNKGAIAPIEGFNDWPFMRIKQRLASAPAGEGDYIVTAWLQVQAPTGITALTADSWEYLPTLGFGKGFGPFDIQGTVGVTIPASHTEKIGHPVLTNIAFQYHIEPCFWPEVEVNWTYYPDGQRGGLNQVFITTGLVLGRFTLAKGIAFTTGFGYQTAVSPPYRAKPQTPSYNHAWLFTSRLNF
jgi:hypothetical protein